MNEGLEFGKLPRELLERFKDPKVSDRAKLLCSALTIWMDACGQCWPSRQKIGQALNWEIWTVMRAKKDAEEAGLIKVKRRGRSATMISWAFSQGDNGATLRNPQGDNGATSPAAQGNNPVDPKVANLRSPIGRTKPEEQQTKKPKEKKERRKAAPEKFAAQTQAILDWWIPVFEEDVGFEPHVVWPRDRKLLKGLLKDGNSPDVIRAAMIAMLGDKKYGREAAKVPELIRDFDRYKMLATKGGTHEGKHKKEGRRSAGEAKSEWDKVRVHKYEVS